MNRLTRRLRFTIAAASAAVLAGASVLAIVPGIAQARPSAPAKAASAAAVAVSASSSTQDTRQACAAPVKPGEAMCLTLIRTNVKTRKGLYRASTTPGQTAPAGYGPSDLQSAYNLPSATAGSGATVAVVDAYNDPNIAADLATYRQQYGLPACTQDSGCFQVVNQDGQPSPLPANAGTAGPNSAGWDVEESLDVDMVSATCPLCKIILVEASSSNNSDIYTAEDAAVTLGAKYVSDSWASCEDPGEQSDDQYFDHPGVVITAASGDWGYDDVEPPADCFTPSYPASSPDVTSVGGTTLTQDASVSRRWDESAWDAGGSGCSVYEPQPSWQAGRTSGCANKATADVSAVADPNTAVAMYDSYSRGGWNEAGGTSVATPIIAATYALAGMPAAGSNPAAYPYAHYAAGPSAFNDVTSGTNGTCTPSVLCTAGPGWDGPTGLGTPDGVTGFAAVQTGSITGTVTDASTGQVVAGATVSASEVSVTTGSDGTYTLADLPAGSYQVAVTAYGYQQQTQQVTVTASQAATLNFPLTGTPHVTVSGTVTAGTGTPWPLYAQVSWSDGNGHSGSTYTTPGTGKYSLSMLENSSYTLTVTPVTPGYTTPAAQTVTVGTGDVTQDFAPAVDLAACTAIGYHTVLTGSTQPFDSSSAPAGWQVANTSLGIPDYSNTPGWVFSDPGARGNQTGGTGGFAVVDSDHDGQFHYQDTDLISPALDFSDDTSPAVQFAADYQPAVNSAATVDVSVDGGKTWANVWTSKGFPGDPGPATVAVLLPQAAGHASVRVRFGYTGQWSQWWEIDNVFLGQRTCTQQAGSLLVGRVADSAGNAVNGAVVASVTNPAETTTTMATPGDASVNGGLYELFVAERGSQHYTATATGYTQSTQSATVTPGQVSTLNFTLTAASG